MTLADNCWRLTNEHKTMGPKGPITVPALLDQLSEAVHPNNGGGVTGGAGARLPVNATALALLQDVEREARESQAELIPTFRGDLKAIIRSWAVEPINGEWQEYLTNTTREWVKKIDRLLSPIKPYHPSKPCPACGQRFHGEDNTPTLALTWISQDGDVMHPEEWAMECEACGAEWTGSVLGAVAWAMNTDT